MGYQKGYNDQYDIGKAAGIAKKESESSSSDSDSGSGGGGEDPGDSEDGKELE